MLSPNKRITLSPTKVEELLIKAGLDVNYTGRIRDKCPVHNGDNSTALDINIEFQNWKCWTRGCHNKHGSDLVGFFSGMKGLTREETIKWLEEQNATPEEVSDETLFLYKKLREGRKRKGISSIKPIPKELFTPNGSEYFKSLGLSDETIAKFQISHCYKRGKPMTERDFVPLYDYNGEYIIGLTGRIPYDRCGLCDEYHSPKNVCPVDLGYHSPKWKHYGVYTENYLYNIHLAKQSIRESGCAIIFEGPKPVWKFSEYGIDNCVASLGCDLNEEHLRVLSKLGVRKAIICFDNDPVGRKKFYKAKKLIGDSLIVYSLYQFIPNDSDPFDIDDEKMLEVKQYIDTHAKKKNIHIK